MRKILLNALLVVSLAVPMLAQPSVAFAACPGGSKGEALQGIGEKSCNDSGVTNVVHAVVNILSLVVGMIAIIMIIVAGLKYITSGGDSNAVANAKSTLIYALIGLAVAALAQVLVHFVLFQTQKAVGG